MEVSELLHTPAVLPRHPLDRGMSGTQNWSRRFGDENKFFKTTLNSEYNTKVKGKGKFNLRTDHEGPYEE